MLRVNAQFKDPPFPSPTHKKSKCPSTCAEMSSIKAHSAYPAATSEFYLNVLYILSKLLCLYAMSLIPLLPLVFLVSLILPNRLLNFQKKFLAFIYF